MDESQADLTRRKDSSREMFWCDQVTGLSQNFWLRALGWYTMALLDTLDKADPACGARYDNLKNVFRELIDAMLQYQDESGMWYQVVNLGGMEKNYLETSGSSIMAYALLKGVGPFLLAYTEMLREAV